ncbi:MAG: putative OsmC-like protein [Planctomycetota bacterium]|jgi:uncharacterized OsmC-like protein
MLNNKFVALISGNDFGPTLYEFVSAGLGACTAITLSMYADRKEWDVEQVIVHVNHSKIETAENTKTNQFVREIQFVCYLDDRQIKRLLLIADKCPVYKSLHNLSLIETRFKVGN